MDQKLDVVVIRRNLSKYKDLESIIKSKLENWIKKDNSKSNLFKSDHSFSIIELLNFKITEKDYIKLINKYNSYLIKNKKKLTFLDYEGLKYELGVRTENYKWRIDTLNKIDSFCILAKQSNFSDKKIFNKIKNNPFTFIFEMEFVKYCVNNNISVIPEPKISGKTPDFFILINGEKFIVDCSIEHIKDGTGAFVHKLYSKIKKKYEKYESIAKRIDTKIIYVTTDQYTLEMLDFFIQGIASKLRSEKLPYLKGLFVFNKDNWRYFDLEE